MRGREDPEEEIRKIERAEFPSAPLLPFFFHGSLLMGLFLALYSAVWLDQLPLSGSTLRACGDLCPQHNADERRETLCSCLHNAVWC